MAFKSIALAAITLVLSTSTNAATVATSLMDNDGEWSIGNTSNPFVTCCGLTPTAGSDLMHFNSQLLQFSGAVDVSFSGVSMEAGTYVAKIDVGNYDNAPLASVDIIGMTADGVLLSPIASVNPLPALGAFETWVFSYVIPTGGSVIGNTLGFTIDVATNGVAANIAFDNLRIDYEQVSAVPIPSAVWLFGSGLIGLIGIARRKKA